MLKKFSLLISILIAGKLITASHPAYNFNDDLSSGQPVRIPTEQPALPIGTPTTIFPIDPGTISNPVVNPVVSDPLLIDDALGVDKPEVPVVQPGTTIKPLEPIVNTPVVPTDTNVVKPPVPTKPTDSDDDSVDLVVGDLLQDLSDEEDFDEDDADLVRNPANAVTINEETRLNGTTNKTQGMISWLFSSLKYIVCWPFRCFYWCCSYDSASDTKKSN